MSPLVALDMTELLSDLFAEHVPIWGDLPAFVQMSIVAFLPALVMVLAVVTPVGILGVWGERRVSALMQDRSGPNYVGIPFLHKNHRWARLWGLGQGLADGIKLLGKEDFVPPRGEPFLFLLAPVIGFAGALGLFVALPLSDGLIAADLNVGIFYLLAVGAIEVIAVLMAGWASNNKWSLLGAMREVAQVVSYEIPMGIVALCPVLLVGSLAMGDMVAGQQTGEGFLWFLDVGEGAARWGLGWNVFSAFPFNLIAVVIFYTCVLANLKRAPFDLPESESELVSGFLTEYSGMRWSLFFLGEYAAMFALSGVTATLFLGGWGSGPFYALLTSLDVPSMAAGVVEFSWKTVALFLLMLQVRWTLPRLRLDSVMALCYKYFVPFALLCLMANGVAALLSGGAA